MRSIDVMINDRAVSSFHISIGTALMLESLFDPVINVFDPDRKIDRIDPGKYKYHYINVLTMIRNIVTSFKNNDSDTVLYDRNGATLIANVLYDELEVIDELYSNIILEPILFIPDYSKVFKNALNKDYSGHVSKKDEIYLMSLNVIKLVNERVKNKELPITSITGTHLLNRSMENVLITTHIPLDLLNVKRIPNLYLLESHTGKLKDKKLFNTKYHKMGKTDMTNLPFVESLMYLLGDGVLILQESIGVRREIHKLSLERKWTPFSNNTIVSNDLKKLDVVSDRVKKFVYVY